jgi:hypothetical protein
MVGELFFSALNSKLLSRLFFVGPEMHFFCGILSMHLLYQEGVVLIFSAGFHGIDYIDCIGGVIVVREMSFFFIGLVWNLARRSARFRSEYLKGIGECTAFCIGLSPIELIKR